MKRINIAKSRMEWMQVLEDAGEVPRLKRLHVHIHSAHPPCKLKILPGTKVSDVLAYLDLCEDCLLCPISDPMKTFTPEEVLYDLIENDEKLIAKAPVTIDSDKAREDLMSLLEVDDDPPSEPIDTSEDDAYIRSFFKEKEYPGMKIVVISVLGADREPLEFELRQGMTTEDLLAEADLAGYWLERQGEARYLQSEEELYDLLTDCEKLYASAPVGGAY